MRVVGKNEWGWTRKLLRRSGESCGFAYRPGDDADPGIAKIGLLRGVTLIARG